MWNKGLSCFDQVENVLALLTTQLDDGMIANMSAKLLLKSKEVLSDGAILEMVIWLLPEPVAGCRHNFKYRLYYGKSGVRTLGYDNERPKGDHCHIEGKEVPYEFSNVDKLVEYFLTAVRNRRKQK